MIGKIEKLQDLEYDAMAALMVIGKDKDLLEIFLDDTTLNYSEIKKQLLFGTLPDSINNTIKNLFDKIILTKPLFIDWYLRCLNSDSKDFVEDSAKEKPNKEDKKLPRRYGKELILKDIAKQGGKASNAQLTAISVNDLKNLWANLSNKMVKELLGTPTLSDVDYREIRATIKILETKLKPLLKKK
jgi:hypothetical protein